MNDYAAWTKKDNESSVIVPTEETFLGLDRHVGHFRPRRIMA
jgi:hypothetical protein